MSANNATSTSGAPKRTLVTGICSQKLMLLMNSLTLALVPINAAWHVAIASLPVITTRHGCD